MHVSLVMTLRATEPLFTLALSTIVFGNDNGLRRLVSLIPVVCGASMSALGSADATVAGAVACAASNACFAARGVLTKLIRARHAADNYSLFLHINVIGALMAGGYVVASGAPIVLPDSTPILVVNGVAFWAYLQLSWLVLARVTAVRAGARRHPRGVMRRPVVILAGWLQFGNEITSLNACGIALACGGAALYGVIYRDRRRRSAAGLPAGIACGLGILSRARTGRFVVAPRPAGAEDPPTGVSLETASSLNRSRAPRASLSRSRTALGPARAASAPRFRLRCGASAAAGAGAGAGISSFFCRAATRARRPAVGGDLGLKFGLRVLLGAEARRRRARRVAPRDAAGDGVRLDGRVRRAVGRVALAVGRVVAVAGRRRRHRRGRLRRLRAQRAVEANLRPARELPRRGGVGRARRGLPRRARSRAASSAARQGRRRRDRPRPRARPRRRDVATITSSARSPSLKLERRLPSDWGVFRNFDRPDEICSSRELLRL